MRAGFGFTALITVGLLALAASPAWAGHKSDRHDDRHGYGRPAHERSYDDGFCKHKVKARGQRVQESIKCRDGYRDRQVYRRGGYGHGYSDYHERSDYRDDRRRRDGYDWESAFLAALVGVLQQPYSGYATPYAAPAYEQRVVRVFDSAPDGEGILWRDDRDDTRYSVVPTRSFRTAGRYCREYQTIATVGGRAQQAYGTACRQPDGAWEVQ